MSDSTAPVTIVGGGWAGLSCAVELARLGHAVTVLESARQLGGRARRVAFNELAVDNGQHLLLGAYHQTLGLLDRLGINREQLFYRQPMELSLLNKNGRKGITLRLPSLISPLNLLVGLFRMHGLRFNDRLHALRFGLHLFSNRLVSNDDTTVAELLKTQGQSTNNIHGLWEPICLAALNTPIEEASAQLFIRVLHDSFCRTHHDADIIIPRVDLGELLPDHAFDFIERQGGNVRLGQRINAIGIENQRIRWLISQDNKYESSHVVLAVPPHACQPLIKPHAGLHDIAYNMSAFAYHPICTVYLRYPPEVQTDRPLQGLLESTAQWLIDRRLCNQPGVIAAVISGPGKHMQLSNAQLGEQVKNELRDIYPHWPAPTAVMVIREKRATFSARVGINQVRPANRTPVKGLWLAGDYTNTGYPATIESAIISGQQTATMIHHEVSNT